MIKIPAGRKQSSWRAQSRHRPSFCCPNPSKTKTLFAPSLAWASEFILDPLLSTLLFKRNPLHLYFYKQLFVNNLNSDICWWLCNVTSETQPPSGCRMIVSRLDGSLGQSLGGALIRCLCNILLPPPRMCENWPRWQWHAYNQYVLTRFTSIRCLLQDACSMSALSP